MSVRQPLLPVEYSSGFVLDPDKAREIGETLKDQYVAAEPYPSIVIDDFLPIEMAKNLLDHFPVDTKSNDKVYKKGYGGLHKRQILPYDCDEYARSAFSFFNSPSILQFLEGVTNIKGLLPDPYFSGGGFHEITTGGLLGVHADFRVNERLQLIRRVNLLIYLNEDWQDSYNGKLELWDREMKGMVKNISPIFNRCAIFNTEDDTFHGHPEPLTVPEGITRKSIALYYYTATDIKNDSGESRHTLYVARPNDSDKTKAEVKKLDKKRARRAKKHLIGSEKNIFKRIWKTLNIK